MSYSSLLPFLSSHTYIQDLISNFAIFLKISLIFLLLPTILRFVMDFNYTITNNIRSKQHWLNFSDIKKEHNNMSYLSNKLPLKVFFRFL
mgnify:CR=1 FL=1